MQDHLHQAQGRKKFAVPPSIHEPRRALGAQLCQGDRLARLVGTSPLRRRVGTQMGETVAHPDRQDIQDDLT